MRKDKAVPVRVRVRGVEEDEFAGRPKLERRPRAFERREACAVESKLLEDRQAVDGGDQVFAHRAREQVVHDTELAQSCRVHVAQHADE